MSKQQDRVVEHFCNRIRGYSMTQSNYHKLLSTLMLDTWAVEPDIRIVEAIRFLSGCGFDKDELEEMFVMAKLKGYK